MKQYLMLEFELPDRYGKSFSDVYDSKIDKCFVNRQELLSNLKKLEEKKGYISHDNDNLYFFKSKKVAEEYLQRITNEFLEKFY